MRKKRKSMVNNSNNIPQRKLLKRPQFLLLSLTILLAAVCLPTNSLALTRLENARIDAVDVNNAEMSVRDCIPVKDNPENILCNGPMFQVKVNDLALRARLKEFHVGDHIRLNINDKNELEDIRGLWSIDISSGCRILVLIVSALVLFGFAAVVTKGAPLKFIVGEDNRYSNSKFQVALWFWVLLSSYLAVVALRGIYAGWDFFGRVSIPQNLLVLSGLSVLTYGGAKAITTAKVNAAASSAAAAAQVGAVIPAVTAVRPNLAVATVPGEAVVNPLDPKKSKLEGQESVFQDLLQNDIGQFDFGDFQMLVVTLIAVGMYLTLSFHFLGSIQFQSTASLPDLDSTVLASFGLGQGAYLTKKAAGNAGTS
jgi:hypothetical protein